MPGFVCLHVISTFSAVFISLTLITVVSNRFYHQLTRENDQNPNLFHLLKKPSHTINYINSTHALSLTRPFVSLGIWFGPLCLAQILFIHIIFSRFEISIYHEYNVRKKRRIFEM